MPESQGDFENLPMPVAVSAIRAIQSATELASVQGLPITNWHLLFGIVMVDDHSASSYLKSAGITETEILDRIPPFFPSEEPPF